jgi:hypothetical protein
MLQVVIGWIQHRLGFLPVDTITIDGADALDIGPAGLAQELTGAAASQIGIRFQLDEFRRLFNRIGHWETVEFFTARGRPIEGPDDFDKGADGGLDGIIRITAPTERGARIIAGRISKIIVKQDY